MAQNSNNPSSVDTRRFDKSLVEDVNDFHLPENAWAQARNAINNSISGDLGKLGNESANLACGVTDYTIIGIIHLTSDYWVIYSTNSINIHDIGIYQESRCLYTRIVRDPCLKFHRFNLIKGVSRLRSTCKYTLYWDDGVNPSRSMSVTIDNIEDNFYTNPNSTIPWIQNCGYGPGVPPPPNIVCPVCVNTSSLDCDDIRLAKFVTLPCIKVNKGVSGGTLLNGSYIVAAAYLLNGQQIGDWVLSNVQPLYEHVNTASSLDITFSNLDQDFDEIKVAIISVTNQQTAARLAGTYSTRTTGLSFDTIDNTWIAIPIENFPLMTPIDEKSDSMFNANDYLIRTGPTSKEDFNYQPLANQIVTLWQSVEYTADYYRNGGNNTNYLRDEIYPFFIRWVYDTGDKSSSYHIPGRPDGNFSTVFGWDFNTTTGDDVLVGDEGPGPAGVAYMWDVYNTAKQTGTPNTVLADGGIVIAEGIMGYWESTEKYPDNKSDVWDANILVSPYNQYCTSLNCTSGSQHNLCGKPIRHHKFPDLNLSPQTQYYNAVNNTIRIMGVRFDNIKYPLKNDGTPVPGIVGYEILRGSRNGYKTILAKGLINNMRTYLIPGVTPRLTLFPNYPYNETGDLFSAGTPGIGRPDPFMSLSETSWGKCDIVNGSGGGENNYDPQVNYSQSFFTFHSPDTNFTTPYLSAKELKIHGEMNGDVVGKFEYSEKHPQEKLMSNFIFLISSIIGIGLTISELNGNKTTIRTQPKIPGYSKSPDPGWTMAAGNGLSFPGTVLTSSGEMPQLADIPGINAGLIGMNVANTAFLTTYTAQSLLTAVAGVSNDSVFTALQAANNTAILGAKSAFENNTQTHSKPDGLIDNIPSVLSVAANLPIFFSSYTKGTDAFLELFKAITPYKDYALRYHSHGFYNRYLPPVLGNQRRTIFEQQYIGPQITDFGLNVRINNLYRPQTVSLQIINAPFTDTLVNDVTRIIASNVDPLFKDISPIPPGDVLYNPTSIAFGSAASNYNTARTTPLTAGNAGFIYPGHSGIQIASSHFASLKQRIRNQYGQINGVVQLLTGACIQTPPAQGGTITSTTIFGGDTYVGRYTEKNTFFFFYNWLYGEPDGAQFDYTKNVMIPYPRFWANFDGFETGDFMSSILPALQTAIGPPITFPDFSTLVLPNDYYNLDGLYCLAGGWINPANIRLQIRYAYFYLFSSGVKDFFTESEINIALRDYGDLDSEQHFDPYRLSDTKTLFDTRLIKVGNYYKYDQSLSISKLFINYVSWASTQPNNYDPLLAETCYIYRPNKLIYSLPAQFEQIGDTWNVFLPNNYTNFLSKISGMKSVNKSGLMIFFESQSPLMFQGLDQLQTGLGTALTIGDGALFSQPQQNVTNAERPYEYASSQSRLGIINTPVGIFWISQNQGKIFSFNGGLKEISSRDLKWWFNTFLPYKLTVDFPDFELMDNPVAGIGCQAIYDNENSLLYFTKKDYQLRTDLPVGTTVEYVSGTTFNVLLNNVFLFTTQLGDDDYFQSASWTISYDPKEQDGGWISYHDWHPDLMMPGKNTFLTIKNNGIWLHNERSDLYCNYYGIDYPFEVEYMVNTVQTVNTLRSVEYILEVYKYSANNYDRFHVLDFNFDEAVIYNTEQVSGLLSLNLEPNNDPFLSTTYPIIQIASIDILFSKVEQKYRFDQFWDITDDRGEFPPYVERVIWNTEANGYIRILNPANLNYNKDSFQRKKMRHYTNSVILRRLVSGANKMLVLLTNNKELHSPR